MHNLLTLAALVALALPADAKSAVQLFHEQNKQYGLIFCNSNPDHNLQFAPGTSAENIAIVKANAAAFKWVDTLDAVPVKP